MIPLIFFVDDNADTCRLFTQAAANREWQVETFLNPLDVLSALVERKPWVIISDQSMEQMKGDELLSITRMMSPHTLRIMQTGHTDEALLVDSISKAGVIDFIQKPWTADRILKRVEIALNLYRSDERVRKLAEQAESKEEELRDLRSELRNARNELEIFRGNTSDLHLEIENWAPAAIVWAIKNKSLPSAGKKTVATMVFVINTGILPDTIVQGRHLRAQIIQAYSDSVLRHSGWRESLGGGITASHFGLLGGTESVTDAAMASALELKIALENLQRLSKVDFGCNLVLDVKDDVLVQVNLSIVNTPSGIATQKSLDVSDFNFANFRKTVESLKKDAHDKITIYTSKEFAERLTRFKPALEPMTAELDGDQLEFFKVISSAVP